MRDARRRRTATKVAIDDHTTTPAQRHSLNSATSRVNHFASMTSRSIVAHHREVRARPRHREGRTRARESVMNYTAERRAMNSERKIMPWTSS